MCTILNKILPLLMKTTAAISLERGLGTASNLMLFIHYLVVSPSCPLAARLRMRISIRMRLGLRLGPGGTQLTEFPAAHTSCPGRQAAFVSPRPRLRSARPRRHEILYVSRIVELLCSHITAKPQVYNPASSSNITVIPFLGRDKS